MNDRIEGWKAIAHALGVGRLQTVMAWAKRAKDPLPVRKDHHGVYAYASALKAWAKRQDRPVFEAQRGAY